MAGGRPTVVTAEVLQKLEEAFAMGCTDLEACFYANIGKSTLYNYQNENPDFLERKDELKERPVLLARQSVIKGMQEDSKLAFDYLKNKRSDEFSTKTKSEVSLNPLQELYSELDGRTSDLPRDEEQPSE